MKKFLSLVLAVIMTMSLVTISAGATEYRDLTDKDEIQYEEAVAVLNRLGIITGYDDGSFRPDDELTRGAAAKIIVSLLIGPDAASGLTAPTAPYPDVPTTHTFAGVISFCKTSEIISGYGDGTFKPGNPLTGFAFAKMLLGALGYNSKIERFVDTGWTQNVAKVGNVAGLFDRLDFDGAGAVNRETACQLALNTLKATMVTYGGTTVVTGANQQSYMVQGTQAMYVTSNNREINANINRRVINATNNEMTLEFGEEHFKDLRLEHDKYDPAYDIYGHPSNEWSYKKVTIGTFALEADYTFTKQISHLEDTTATKEKALGLRGYDTYSTDHRANYTNWSTAAGGNIGYNSPFNDATQITINGWNARVYNDDYKQGTIPTSVKKEGDVFSYDASKIGASNKEEAPTLSEIADLTDNGVTVEIYVCPVDADFITDVVVTRTQLMEVDRVASDFVELDVINPDSKDETLAEIAGYNDQAFYWDVEYVKDDNYDAYNSLKDLKEGDKVAVIPYTEDDGKTWEVGEAYVPETASGVFTNVDIYNTKSKDDGNAIAITIGGTTYPIAQWNKDMREVNGYQIKATKKDVTVYLDKLGNALWADEIGNSDDWMIVGDYYQAAGTNGRVGWFVHGWTISGTEVDLELGTIRGAAEKYAPGDLVRYKVAEAGNGEYELDKPNYGERAFLKDGSAANWTEPALKKDGNKTGEGVYNVSQYAHQTNVATGEYAIKSVNSLIPLEFYNTYRDSSANSSSIAGPHFNYDNADRNTKVGSATGECGYLVDPNAQYPGAIGGNNPNAADMWTYKTAPYDGVKFIYVGFDSSTGEVETINFLSGVQNVTHEELGQINRWWRNVGTNVDGFVASPAEAYVNKDGKVKAVVIKSDSAEANLSDLMIITDNRGANTSTKTVGAEAPASGTYYTRQYVSGEDGFKEEKTGYFDQMLSVGTVITGTLQENGIIRTRVFHAREYTGRNPDGLYVKGITPLKTLNDVKSGTAFYIGPNATAVNGVSSVITTLGTGVSASSYPLTADDCEILTGKDVMGIDEGISKEGLIKVDGTTQWIDLRDGRPGDVRELDDLWDYKNDANIELKILLNGNTGSDGFRHAYAILILEAHEGDENAAVPGVSIGGKTEKVAGSGTFNKNEKATGTGSKNNPYVFTITPETEIKLTAKVNVTGEEKNSEWKVLTANADWYTVDGESKSIVVVAPEKTGDKVELTYTVTNHDNTVKDDPNTTRTVYVNVVAGESEEEPTGDVKTETITTKLGFTIKYTAQMKGNDTVVRAELVGGWPSWVSTNNTNKNVGAKDATIEGYLAGSTMGFLTGGKKFTFTPEKTWCTDVISGYTASNTQSIVIAEDTVSGGENGLFVPSNVIIEYTNNTGVDLVTKPEVMNFANGSTAGGLTLALATSVTNVPITVTADATTLRDANDASNPKTATVASNATAEGANPTNFTVFGTGSIIHPSGKSTVKITLEKKNTSDTLTVAYAVTSHTFKIEDIGDSTNTTGTLALTVAPAGPFSSGEKTQLNATINNMNSFDAYKVTVTLPGQTPIVGFVDTVDTATPIGSAFAVTKNIDLADATVEVKGLMDLDLSADSVLVSPSGTTYTITFNQAIKLKDGLVYGTDISCNDSSTHVIDARAEGSKLIVTTDQAVPSSKKLQAAAGSIMSAERESDKLTAATDLYEAP